MGGDKATRNSTGGRSVERNRLFNTALLSLNRGGPRRKSHSSVNESQTKVEDVTTSSEKKRISSEVKRISSEVKRISSEVKRVSNEKEMPQLQNRSPVEVEEGNSDKSGESFDSGFVPQLDDSLESDSAKSKRRSKGFSYRIQESGFIPPPTYIKTPKAKIPSPAASEEPYACHSFMDQTSSPPSKDIMNFELSPFSDMVSKTSKWQTKFDATPLSSVYARSISSAMKSFKDSPCGIKAPVTRREYTAREDKVDTKLISAINNEGDSDEGSWDEHNTSSEEVKTAAVAPWSYAKSTARNLSFSSVDSTTSDTDTPKRKRHREEDENPKKFRTSSGAGKFLSRSMDVTPSTYRSPFEDHKPRSNSENNKHFRMHHEFVSPVNSPFIRDRLFQHSVGKTLSRQASLADTSSRQRHPSRQFLPFYNVAALQSLPSSTGFIDTHCHLDFLFKRANHSGSYASYRKLMKNYYPENYEGCVAVFCDPLTFKQKWLWKSMIEEEGVWAAFGCHPHNSGSYNEEIDEDLCQALRHPKVRALGEIGLDYSSRNNCNRKVQHKVLKRQLQLALERNLPLVIHCREAHEDCLEIMAEIVPRDHYIHLHCFTDTWARAKMWLNAFPNLYIGITNVVTFPSATTVHETVRNLPLDRLLLETDAPYFLPRALPKNLKWAHPGMAVHVAAQIATIKGNVTIEGTLKAARDNTRAVYKI